MLVPMMMRKGMGTCDRSEVRVENETDGNENDDIVLAKEVVLDTCALNGEAHKPDCWSRNLLSS